MISELDQKLPPKDLLELISLTKNYLITDLQGLLKVRGVSGEDFMITPENFGDFITLIHDGKISSKIAKIVLSEMFANGGDPAHIIQEKGLVQITDEAELEKIVNEVISKNQKPVEDFKIGKENALQFLMGQVMAKTQGKASPSIIRQLLLTKLKC